MTALYPLQFGPVFRRYIWGGRRLESSLNKTIGSGCDWAESWEICDLGAAQSIVDAGPLAGLSLGQLVSQYGNQLLGRHHPQPRFPLLLKYLDATQTLSVQVHPGHFYHGGMTPPAHGKSEAWVVLQTGPNSQIYAGLRPGIDRPTLTAAILDGRCQECLHAFHPLPGDCVYLPAGTIHALGEGLLVAEIQQASDVTYRLFDWNRIGPDGAPRPLHIEHGLDATNFGQGPVVPRQPATTEIRQVQRLIECPYFVMDRWEFDSPLSAGGDDRCHIVTVLDGMVRVEGNATDQPLIKGSTVLLSAVLGATRLTPLGKVVLLDCYLP